MDTVKHLMNIGIKILNQNKMKAILEFNLPEEQAEHYCAIKGADMLNALFDIRLKLRGMLKYEELTDQQYEMVQKIQGYLIQSLEDNEINLDK